MNRREARKHAFVLIYQYPFHQPQTSESHAELYDFYIDGLPEEGNFDKADEPYIKRVTEGALARLDELDGVIARYLKDWEIARINRIDLAILRLGVYELRYEPEIPAGAAINEAVELAKAYGADESAAFVNGVLGGVAREETAVRGHADG